ncbi:MAG TPA: hypothetical protein VEA79_10995 [Phenylobacterium sp.]|nr:hypothetical protein [Phenylobacterium sp.]
MSLDRPKHPSSPVDPGGAKPTTPPPAPQPEAEEPGGMINEGGRTTPDEHERKGGMVGEG